MCRRGVIRYYLQFPVAVPGRGAGCPRVTQPFATLYTPEGALTVRLACVKRAASVHPEPGSNSPFKTNRRSGPIQNDGADPSPRSRRSRIQCELHEVCTRSYTLRILLWSVSRRSHRSQYPVFKVRRARGPVGPRAAQGDILGKWPPKMSENFLEHISYTLQRFGAERALLARLLSRLFDLRLYKTILKEPRRRAWPARSSMPRFFRPVMQLAAPL